MMQQPIQEGRGQNLIAQQGAPLGKTGITGEQNGISFIARCDNLKEEMRLLGREPGVADLVNE